jgi:outer membrane cobalamin receptor
MIRLIIMTGLKKVALLLGLLGLCCKSVYGQVTGVLRGKVTAASNHELLSSASVRMLSNAAHGTVTDPDGVYSLVLDTGTHTIVCMYLGLLTDTFIVQIAADRIATHDVVLQSNSEILNTVVVSSGKFNQKLNELTLSMEVLKPSLISNKNTTSIESALEQVPGLTIIDNDPQIRGGSGFTFGVGSRVAIVQDGIPLLSGDAGRPEWSYIPVENISQIEIIKGTSSVLYGSGAINGVINIRTAYPSTVPRTTISYSAGAYSLPQAPASNWYNGAVPGFMNLNFLHSRIIGKNLDFVIGGNFNIDQGYEGPAPPLGYLPQDLKKVLLLNDSIPVFSNRDMLKQRARLNFSLRYHDPNITGLSYGLNGNAMINKTNMVMAWLDDSAGLYRGFPGAVFMENQTFFNLDPFIRYDGSNGVSHSLVTRIFHTDDVMTNNQSTSGTLYYAEYQLQKKYAGTGITFTGGVVNNISVSHASLYDSSGSPDNKVVNESGYIQLDKKFLDILNLSGGVRYEYYQTNSLQSVTQPIFRAGASLKVLEGTWIRTSYGDGYRYPTITERYISTKAGLFGVFPNPGLQPETSHNFEIGIKQGFKIGDCMGYLDVAGFQQNYHNTIEYLFAPWKQDVSLFGFKFVNTGDSRVSGADFSLACATPESHRNFGVTVLAGYTYTDPVSLTPDLVYAHTKGLPGGVSDTNYSYRSTSVDTNGHVLKYRFRHMLKFDAETRIYKAGIGLSYRYYSKMQNIDAAFSEIEGFTKVLNATYHQFQTIDIMNYWRTHNGFHIIDARISYKFSERHKLSLVCNNLLNVTYFLRPLKIEPPRTVALQYVFHLG